MNAKISVFVICVEAIIYLLLYDLHEYTFESLNSVITTLFHSSFVKKRYFAAKRINMLKIICNTISMGLTSM